MNKSPYVNVNSSLKVNEISRQLPEASLLLALFFLSHERRGMKRCFMGKFTVTKRCFKKPELPSGRFMCNWILCEGNKAVVTLFAQVLQHAFKYHDVYVVWITNHPFCTLFTDKRRHSADKESSCCIKPARASEKIIREVRQDGNASNSLRLRWNGNWWRRLLPNTGAKHRIDCGVQRGAMDWCEFNELLLFVNHLTEIHSNDAILRWLDIAGVFP